MVPRPYCSTGRLNAHIGAPRSTVRFVPCPRGGNEARTGRAVRVPRGPIPPPGSRQLRQLARSEMAAALESLVTTVDRYAWPRLPGRASGSRAPCEPKRIERILVLDHEREFVDSAIRHCLLHWGWLYEAGEDLGRRCSDALTAPDEVCLHLCPHRLGKSPISAEVREPRTPRISRRRRNRPPAIAGDRLPGI